MIACRVMYDKFFYNENESIKKYCNQKLSKNNLLNKIVILYGMFETYLSFSIHAHNITM